MHVHFHWVELDRRSSLTIEFENYCTMTMWKQARKRNKHTTQCSSLRLDLPVRLPRRHIAFLPSGVVVAPVRPFWIDELLNSWLIITLLSGNFESYFILYSKMRLQFCRENSVRWLPSIQALNRQHKGNLEQNEERNRATITQKNTHNVSIFSWWFVQALVTHCLIDIKHCFDNAHCSPTFLQLFYFASLFERSCRSVIFFWFTSKFNFLQVNSI